MAVKVSIYEYSGWNIERFYLLKTFKDLKQAHECSNKYCNRMNLLSIAEREYMEYVYDIVYDTEVGFSQNLATLLSYVEELHSRYGCFDIFMQYHESDLKQVFGIYYDAFCQYLDTKYHVTRPRRRDV